MAEYIEREALLCMVRPDDPSDEKAAITIATAKKLIRSLAYRCPASDVAPVRHGRCPVCSGNAVLTQDCDNGYSLEIDADQQETSLWYGDECMAVFHIDYYPSCGAKMDLEATHE